MALSSLYPATTKAKNWDAAYAAPATRLATKDLPLLLEQLDQYWDLAPEPVLVQIRKCSPKVTSLLRVRQRRARLGTWPIQERCRL